MRPFFFVVTALMLATCMAATGEAQAQSTGRYWHPSLTLRDTDTAKLARWLDRFGMPVPFTIEGKVTVDLKGGVPLSFRNARNVAAYELDGTLTSSRLVVNGVAVQDLSATIRYRSGIMELTSLSFQWPREQGEARAARVNGRATLPLVPRGDLSMNAQVNDLTYARIAKWAGAAVAVEGLVKGTADMRVAGANFTDLNAWSGSAALESTGFKFDIVSIPSAEMKVALANQRVTIERLRGTVADKPVKIAGSARLSDDRRLVQLDDFSLAALGGRIQTSGSIPLVERRAESFTLRVEGLNLAEVEQVARDALQKAIGVIWPPLMKGKLSANMNVVVPFANLEQISDYRVAGQAALPTLKISAIAVNDVSTQLAFDGTTIRLDQMRWNWVDSNNPGSAVGAVAVGLQPQGVIDGALRFERMPAPPIGAAVKVPVQGHVSGNIQARVSTRDPTDPSKWSMQFDLRGESLRSGDYPIELQWLRADLERQELTIRESQIAWNGEPIRFAGRSGIEPNQSSIRLNDGKLTAAGVSADLSARWPLAPRSAGSLNARWQGLRLNRLSQILDLPIPLPDETLSGEADLKLSSADDAGGRTASAALNLDGIVKGFANVETSLVDWRDPMKWKGSIDLAMTRPINVAGRSVEESAVQANLDAGVLMVAKLQAIVNAVRLVGSGMVKWQANPEAVIAENWRLEVLNGKVDANTRYPLAATSPASADIKLQGIDLEALQKVVGVDSPRLVGKLDGAVKATVDPADQNGDRAMSVAGSVASQQIDVGKFQLTNLSGTVSTEQGKARYEIGMSLLGGALSVAGTEDLTNSPSADGDAALASEGTLRLRDINVGRVLAVAAGPDLQELVRGRASLAVDYSRRRGETMRGGGRLLIEDVSSGSVSLAPRLQANVAWNGTQLSVNEFSGDVFGGSVRASLALDLTRLGSGAPFDLSLRQADLRLLAELVGVDLPVSGRANVQVRGRVAQRIVAAGQVSGDRAAAHGISISTWRSPVVVWIGATGGSIEASQLSVQLARGSLRGQVSYAWGGASRFESSIQFVRLDVKPLLASYPSLSSYGQGRVTGRATLKAIPLRSSDDLSGTISARLESFQAGRMPVLDEIMPIVSGANGSALVFNDGKVEATLGRGVLRLQEFALTSPQLRLFADGTIRTNGALDLNVTATTINPSVLDTQMGPFVSLLSTASPPAAIMIRINEAMKDRVIALSVTGRITDPIIQVRPLPILTHEAARFLLGKQLDVTGTGANAR